MLLFCFADEVLSRDGDLTYLDYVKAREQEYEYAMHLRDAMWRDGDRGQGPDDDDDDDDGFVDEQDYDDDSPRSYNDEGRGSVDKDDKSKRNLKTEGRWKEHSNKKDNMKNINANHKDKKLEDSKVSCEFFLTLWLISWPSILRIMTPNVKFSVHFH